MSFLYAHYSSTRKIDISLEEEEPRSVQTPHCGLNGRSIHSPLIHGRPAGAPSLITASVSNVERGTEVKAFCFTVKSRMFHTFFQEKANEEERTFDMHQKITPVHST